jgi:hypothetical protein
MLSNLKDLNKIITGLLERAKTNEETLLWLRLLDSLNKIKLEYNRGIE